MKIDSEFVRQVIRVPRTPIQPKSLHQVSDTKGSKVEPAQSGKDQKRLDTDPIKSIGSWLVLIVIAVLYLLIVWAVLAHVPSLSVAARLDMTARLWLYDVAGFLFGTVVGSSAVYHLLKIFDYRRVHWKSDDYGTPKTAAGLIVALLFMNVVGVYFANIVVNYGLRRP